MGAQLAGVAAIAALAVIVGALAAIQPLLPLLLIALAGVVALAFAAPVANLVALVLITTIVPFGLQNRFGLGVGPGLLPSDALLLAGMCWAGIVLLGKRLAFRQLVVVGAVMAFILIAGLQFMHGLALGYGASQVGYELRPELALGTALIAIPILMDEHARRRLWSGLLVVGLVLGVWGIAQWVLAIPEIGESGAGVREGVRLTSEGKGQIQGGLYGFPIAVLLSFAVLATGKVRSGPVRMALLAVFSLNLASLLLTYERTFWVATVLALCFVALKAGRARRLRTFVWLGAAAVLLFAALSTIAPAELTAARERLLSLGQYDSDDSVRIRILESRHALTEIGEHPLVGSGLGATIFYGRPWQSVPATSEWYIHNGYLWLAWKLGIPAALLFFLLLGWTVAARRRAREEPLLRAVRIGSQAAVLALLIVSVTFPSFTALAITPTIGLLVAIALCMPPTGRGPDGATTPAEGRTSAPLPSAPQVAPVAS